MRFSRKRGRPKQALPEVDKGTPELRARHRAGETLEPIDACRAKGLITDAQWHAARRLAWLFRLQYGKCRVVAMPLDEGSGKPPEENPQWDAHRAEELQDILRLLEKHRLRSLLVDVCVFQRWPETSSAVGMERLCKGLELLVKIFHSH